MKKRKILKILTILTVIGVVVAGGGYFGLKGYRVLRQKHLVKQARAYLEENDQKNALLCLKRAITYNPWDAAAVRLMAGLAEANRSPAALLLRNRVVECKPDSVEDRLALVRTALMLRNFTAATNALEAIPPGDRDTAAYHNLAGSAAGTMGQLDMAAFHFKEAARLEPTNAVLQLNLAALQLHHTNEQVRAEARARLTSLSTNPVVRSQVLRELATDAIRAQQTNDALRLTRELVQVTNSVFGDRLFRLSVLKAAGSSDLQSTLNAFQQEATNQLGSVYELATWMIRSLSPGEALAWLDSLPPDLQTNQPVPSLAAECRILTKDWPGLQASLAEQNWGQLEFLRHAFLARALQGQELETARKSEWELALRTANSQKPSLGMLLSLALQWGRTSDAEEILWDIFNRYPGETWVVQALQRALYLGGRTRSLQMLYNTELQRQPHNLSVKNNLAMTALLLESDELKPHELAREVYEAASTNAAYASTYAFSLYRDEKNTEALKVMEALTPAQLADPSIAGYYGLILKATGDDEKAKASLNAALEGRLLPEERKLFERARAGS